MIRSSKDTDPLNRRGGNPNGTNGSVDCLNGEEQRSSSGHYLRFNHSFNEDAIAVQKRVTCQRATGGNGGEVTAEFGGSAGRS